MQEIIDMINGMSPYLLLGFLLAGLMHAYVPKGFYTKYLSGNTFRSVVNAALFGIPLPLCSCGVIPTAMSLKKEGASNGAVVSFLIATPQTGVDSIMATLGMLGMPFALIRPLAALVTALFGGWLTDSFAGNVKMPEEEHSHSCDGTCHCHSHEEQCHGHDHSHEAHCHCHSHGNQSKDTFWSKMKLAFTYAYVEMMEDIGKWLFIGLVVAALITVFVPTELFAVFQENTWASMLLVLCIAIPMYVCATGSIPIAVALMMKGLTPGAALVLLMAGPACNIASILVIKKSLGLRTMAVYLISIVIGAVAFGYLIDVLQFNGMVDFLSMQSTTEVCHTEEGSGIIGWISSILLMLMLANAILLPKLRLRKKNSCCHCH